MTSDGLEAQTTAPNRTPFPRSDIWWMIALAVAGALVAIVAGHLMVARGGIGFDGRTYARIVVAFPDAIDQVVSPYRAWRVGPSLLVAVTMRAVGVTDPSPEQIVVAFRLLNLAAVVTGVVAWVGIARTLGLRRAATWFGFVALFGGFALLRFPWVNPVTTDTIGFMLGLLLLLAHLRGNRWAVAAIGLAAAFVWQLVFFAAIVFLVLPATWMGDPSADRRRTARWLAVVAGIAAAVLAVLAHLANPDGSVSAPWTFGLPIAILLVGWWVAVLAAPLLAALLGLRVRQVLTSAVIVGAAVAIAIAVAAATAHLLLSGPSGGGPGVLTVVEQSLVQAVARPGAFVVAHVVYLGPWVIVAMLLWRGVAEHGVRLGPAFTVLMLVTGLLALGTESRVLIGTIGVFVIPAAMAFDDLDLGGRWVVGFGVVTLLWSGLWIDAGRVYPERGYFSRFGPWMTFDEWAVFAVLVVATGVVFWLVLARIRSAPTLGQHDVPEASRRGADPDLAGGNVPGDDGPHADLAPPAD